LVQLRTDISPLPLNKYLHRISRSTPPPPPPICPACEEREESVHHFVLSCPAYARHRASLKAELGMRAQSLKGLLNDGKSVKSVLKYIARTKCLKNTFGAPQRCRSEPNRCDKCLAIYFPQSP
ncbi:uncharacterized protein F5147DRAFT_563012, partial [Suillus discolor]